VLVKNIECQKRKATNDSADFGITGKRELFAEVALDVFELLMLIV